MKFQFSISQLMQLVATTACFAAIYSCWQQHPELAESLRVICVIAAFRSIATSIGLRTWRKYLFVVVTSSLLMGVLLTAEISQLKFSESRYYLGAPFYIVALIQMPIFGFFYFIVEFFRILWEIIWLETNQREKQ